MSLPSYPDLATVALFDLFEFEDSDEKSRVRRMLRRAREYLASFDWAGRIVAERVGLAVGDVVAVFLFQLEPAARDVDEWIWVIDGDVPKRVHRCDRGCAKSGPSARRLHRSREGVG